MSNQWNLVKYSRMRPHRTSTPTIKIHFDTIFHKFPLKCATKYLSKQNNILMRFGENATEKIRSKKWIKSFRGWEHENTPKEKKTTFVDTSRQMRVLCAYMFLYLCRNTKKKSFETSMCICTHKAQFFGWHQGKIPKAIFQISLHVFNKTFLHRFFFSSLVTVHWKSTNRRNHHKKNREKYQNEWNLSDNSSVFAFSMKKKVWPNSIALDITTTTIATDALNVKN